MWLSIVVFACVCGAFGEGLEVLRLRWSGIAMPGLALRLTLFVAYAAIGGGLYAVSSLLAGAARARLAAGLFAVSVFVPWANFEFLPAAGSAASLLGSGVVAAAAVLAGWMAARVPRSTAAVVALLAIAVNLGGRATVGDEQDANGVSARGSGKTNVVILLLDTLRADHLGAYGYERPTSPRIDAIAARGVVFERAIAQASWTKPSVASLFTGQFVSDHGVIRSRDTLREDLPTIATVFDDAGYRTAGFSANPWITPEFRFGRGFDHYESGRAMGPQLTNLYRTIRRVERLTKRLGVRVPIANTVFRWAGRSNSGNSVRDEQLTASVLAWLATVEADEPFFLYVHLIGPHDPYDPPAEFAERFARSKEKAPHLPPPRVQTVFERAEPMEPAALERMIDQYDAAIAHADSLVGRIEDEIERRGLAERTVLVVTSDHGEEFYEHGNWRHGNQLYDEVVRVPLVFDLPGDEPARRRDPAMLVDILPTVAHLAGLGLPGGEAAFSGRSLFPDPGETDQPTFSEHWWFLGGTYAARAASRNGLKLQTTRDDAGGRERDELYDLGSDPHEHENLLGGSVDGVVSDDLTVLRRLLAELAGEGPAAGGGQVEMDEATRQRLRDLGYLKDS